MITLIYRYELTLATYYFIRAKKDEMCHIGPTVEEVLVVLFRIARHVTWTSLSASGNSLLASKLTRLSLY